MTPQTTKYRNPINQSVKKHLAQFGEYRLNCIDSSGHPIRARTNTVKGVLAIIDDWRSLGCKKIEVWEPERYGVASFWDVQETKTVS
jgi:hypothetical protein